MKQRPILFSTQMVKAILEGRKTMTRRIMKPQPSSKAKSFVYDVVNWFKKPWIAKFKFQDEPAAYEITDAYKCKFGTIGDVLWVRESFVHGYKMDDEVFEVDEHGDHIEEYWYKATHPDLLWFNGDEMTENVPWKPSIHMPKEACRIFLEITDIKIERLQDISEEDAKAEGAERGIFMDGPNTEKGEFQLEHNNHSGHKDGFKFLWHQINGRDSWNANPWVWVVSFRRIEKPATMPQNNQ